MIALVTDSTCDIPQDVVNDGSIAVVPSLVNIGQQTLRDGIDLSRESFYTMLPHLPTAPTTSAPSPAAFIEVYENALRKADAVVALLAAGRLSGIYNSARLAAREVAPERIHVVDSGQLSMGLGWAVLAALEAVRRAEPVEGVLNAIQNTLNRTRVYALLDTVKYLVRSGRVNPVEMGLSQLLSIKPIVEVRQGIVESVARIRTWTRALGTLTEKVAEFGPLEHLAIMHSNTTSRAQELIDRLRERTPGLEVEITTNATTVLGAHVGPNAVGVAAVLGKAGR